MSARRAAVRRVLGIDPGTLRLGYAVIELGGRSGGRVVGPGMHYLECGVIRAPRTKDVVERLFVIAGELAGVITEFAPAELAIEKAFHGKSAASALALGQARGAVLLLARQHGLATFEYAPASIKRAVVGHGAADKSAVAERVSLIFGLARAPAADAADALAIACCHAFARR